jgi:sulfatase maturation enzyme AslB (radical SAM superfamily)
MVQTTQVFSTTRNSIKTLVVHWTNPETTEKVNYDNDTPCAARKNICVYPNGDVVKCFDHRRIPLAKEPLGNIGRQDIIEILINKAFNRDFKNYEDL